ncbi:choline dehydrogenase [Lophium mytilinum]|uniref:Choline dehydrogenase n=1 Tax=Lophium mytilinum TaxID=390894 RepID=A0A6A6RD19_9PEZI|nr:choline dehydrogenase [Lophium mytilinum]
MATSEESFDFIIIGGGTAGLVIANRLSELPHLQILIVEAGENRNSDPKIQVPGYVTQLFGDPKYDWSFNTVPQKSLNGRVINHPRGKVLGGSSAINAMSTVYPSQKMFDLWTELGNTGWDRNTMAPYYKKFQTFHQPSAELAKELDIDYMDYALYGKDGPVQTAISSFTMPLTRLLGATLKALGHKATKDPISGEAVGAYSCPSYIDPRTATRSHAGVAYYEPVKSRPNLHLKENALVEKIVFEKPTDGLVIATGVQYTINGIRHISHASREVILCAGAFGSPALLELSGIGDPALLTSLNIPVVIANPNVGENLQDHVMTTLTAEVLNPSDSLDSLRDPTKLAEAIAAYTTHRSGPLSAGFSAMAYLPVPGDAATLASLVSTHLTNAPDPLPGPQRLQAQHLASTLLSPTPDSMLSLSAAAVEIFPIHSPSGTNSISLVPALMHPLSRGTVHVVSPSPSNPPQINPRYLSHPLDLDVFARHLLFCNSLFSSQPLTSMLKEGGKRTPQQGLQTLEEAKAYARERAVTQFHPCGTCAMMPLARGGVVGEKLVVHGTGNLRVCDASVFPIVPKGPVTSSVYAVAERGADLVREDLG